MAVLILGADVVWARRSGQRSKGQLMACSLGNSYPPFTLWRSGEVISPVRYSQGQQGPLSSSSSSVDAETHPTQQVLCTAIDSTSPFSCGLDQQGEQGSTHKDNQYTLSSREDSGLQTDLKREHRGPEGPGYSCDSSAEQAPSVCQARVISLSWVCSRVVLGTHTSQWISAHIHSPHHL